MARIPIILKGVAVTGGGGHIDNSLPGIDGPVDPDYGIGSERPDNSLPGMGGPVDPGFGIPLPPVIDNGLPGRPGVWPPQRPTYPVDPNFGIPVGPGAWPSPPVTTWPPPQPVYPSLPIYIRPPHVDNTLPGNQPGIDNTLPGGQPPVVDNTLPGNQPGIDNTLPGGRLPRVDNTLPPTDMPPGAVWPPLPGIEGEVLCLVWIVGFGYRWTTIDPGLAVTPPIAPTPQPK
jgi:hypothetical protein